MLLIAAVFIVFVISLTQTKDHYINSKGQRILRKIDRRGKRFYRSECQGENHSLPIYNNGRSIGIGESDEPCQCGAITVGESRAKMLIEMLDHKGRIPLDSDFEDDELSDLLGVDISKVKGKD